MLLLLESIKYHVFLFHRMLEHSVDNGETDNCSPLAFTVELRPQATDDTGYTGFMVPTEQVSNYAIGLFMEFNDANSSADYTYV